jgi:hypothetical protein
MLSSNVVAVFVGNLTRLFDDDDDWLALLILDVNNPESKSRMKMPQLELDKFDFILLAVFFDIFLFYYLCLYSWFCVSE